MNLRRSNYLLMITVFLVTALMTACGTTTTEENGQSAPQQNTQAMDIDKNPVVTIVMENNDTIQIELYPTIAPNTVNNFLSLIKQGYYNGVIFHRVIPGFMVQGGDPEGTGIGGPGYSIHGEFSKNGFDNPIKHERGVISMARTKDPNSAGSQFFIMVQEASHLDGEYAAFGKVIEGMEAVDNIVLVKTGAQDKPVEDQVMKEVTVETFDHDYPEPEKVSK